MNLAGRLGRFFLLVGLVLLVVFFSSDLARSPKFNLFFLGLASLVLGILLIRQGREPAPPSERFRLLRKVLGASRKKERQPAEGEETEAAGSPPAGPGPG